MPNKKTQRRPNRPKNRRPAAVREPAKEPVTEVVESVTAVPAAASAPPAVARAVGAPARRAPTARRSPAAVMNYAYLRRDLRALGILAPAMIILVILAFIFIH